MKEETLRFAMIMDELYKAWKKYGSGLTFEQFCELRSVEKETK